MNVVRRIFRGITSFSWFCFKGYRFMLLAVLIITLHGVITRYVFRNPAIWTYELGGMIIVPYWMFATVINLVEKTDIKLDIFYGRLSLRKQAILDAFTWLFFWFYIGCVLYYGWEAFMFSFTHGARSLSLWRPLLWPWKLAVPVTCFLVLLQGIVKYGSILYQAITGKELEL